MTGNILDIPDKEIYITLVYLLLVSILGTIGNSIVIYVYKKKNDELTSTLFIIILSAADLIVCLLVIPYTFAMELVKFKMSSDFFCKLYYVINTSNAMNSSLLIVAVALDRYLCICHPMRRILTVRGAKILVAVLVAFSVGIGIGTSLMVEIKEEINYKNHTSANGSNYQTEHIVNYCEEKIKLQNTTASTAIIFKILKNLNHSTFIFCIVSVVVCYSFIFRVVLQVREKNKTLTFREKKPSSPPIETNDNPDVVLYHPSGGEENGDVVEPITIEPRRQRNNKPAGRKSFIHIRKMSFRGIRESELFQNFRSAGMLFMVAFVYILVFTPSLLIVNGYIDFNIFGLYLYYLNNMANPIIYCFMNRGFRRELKRVFFRNRCVQKRFSSFSEQTTPW